MMRNRLSLFSVLALSATVLACGGQAKGEGGLSAVADTVDGAPRLTYPGEGGLPLMWRADTAVYIGEVMGDDDAYQFDRVPPAGLAGDANGNLFVLDRAGTRVLSYDAEGTHRGTFGRKGEGPNELSNPFSLTLGPGDTIWVLDPLGGRLTGFPPDGSDARTVPLGAVAGFPNANFALRAGSFLFQSMGAIRLNAAGGGRGGVSIRNTGAARGGAAGTAQTPPPPVSSDSASAEGDSTGATPTTTRPAATTAPRDPFGDDAAPIPVFRVAMDGTPGDTLWRSTPPETNTMQVGGGGRTGSSQIQMVIMRMPPRYQPALRWAAFADGGIVAVDTDRYELRLVDPAGRVRLIIGRDMPDWPVGETEKEYAREQLRNSQAQVIGGPIDMKQIIEQQIASMTFAPTVPRIARIAIDTQDRIWVGVSLTTPGEVERVDIFAKDGLFLGAVDGLTIPDAFLLDGRGASIVRDPDTDVQRIAVFRIEEQSRR